VETELLLNTKKNLCLFVSKFQDSAKMIREIQSLAQKFGFDLLEITPDQEKENVPQETVFNITQADKSNTRLPRVLHLVHKFVLEDDMPALLQLARESCIGGAGDNAAFAHGFGGDFPPIIDPGTVYYSGGDKFDRGHYPDRIRMVAKTMKDLGYPVLAEWFLEQLDPTIERQDGRYGLIKILKNNSQKAIGYVFSMILGREFTEELGVEFKKSWFDAIRMEWLRFKKEELGRLDISPWAYLLVRSLAHKKEQ
jgi:hypothetical protein